MIGVSFLIDLIGCEYAPTNPEALEYMVVTAVRESGMHIAHLHADDFPEAEWKDDHGASTLALIVPLTESHVAIHTWPDRDGLVCIDFFTCGDPDRAEAAARRLAAKFLARKVLRSERIVRGDDPVAS